MADRENALIKQSMLGLVSSALLWGFPAVGAESPNGHRGMALEEVIVTAQRREESLQQAPVAITALDTEALERRGIRNAEDMIGKIPSLGGFEAPGSKGAVSLSIRGVSGGSPANISSDPANAVYLNNIYLGKMVGLALDVADIERIEILRGPQGTLYGRNSTGGALNIISRKPSGELEGKISATAGNYGLWGVSSTLHLPSMGEEGKGPGKLSSSLSYYRRARNEIYRNSNPHQKGFENLDREAWRIALVWNPVSSIEADYSFDYSKLDELPMLNHVVGFTPATGPLQGSLDRIELLSGFKSAAQFGLLSAAQNNDPTFNRWLGSLDLSIADMEERVSGKKSRPRRGSTDSRADNYQRTVGHSLSLLFGEYDLGKAGEISIRSITGYRKLDNRNGGDMDGMDSSLSTGGVGAINDTTLGALYQLYAAQQQAVDTTGLTGRVWDLVDEWGGGHAFYSSKKDYDQFSQEFQLNGMTDRSDYVVGLFWFEDQGKENSSQFFASPVGGNMNIAYKNKTEAWAFFSQVTWRPPVMNDNLSITAGLRYTEEEKEIKYNYLTTYSPLDARYDGSLQEIPDEPYGSRFKKTFRNASGMANAAYQLTDDLNLYVTYATGYRSGGFNGEVFNNPVGEESVRSWEVGLKSDWWDNRLRVNTAVWRYKYKDMQVSQILVSEGGAVTSNIINAGQATRWGGEVEAKALLTHELSLELSYSYIKGHFNEYPELCAELNCIDNTSSLARRTMSPGNQLSAAVDYVFFRTRFGELTGHAAAYWQDKAHSGGLWTGFYGQSPNTEMVAYDSISTDKRTVVDARISLEDIPLSKGHARVSLWAKNLLDKKYSIYGMNFASLGPINKNFGEPRTYGVELSYEF